MTIIEPKLHVWRARAIIAVIFGFAAVLVFLNIYWYAGIVDARHAAREAERSTEALELAHADLTNEVYALFEESHVRDAAASLGYVIDARPAYITIPREILAQQL